MQCKNCYHEIKDEINYCESCGAKVIRNRINLRNLWHDFTEQFLNYDNKLLKTFIHLFTKPGAVIGSYISGTRKRYVNVLSYFAIAVSISGIQIFILKKFYPELLDFSAVSATQEAAAQNLAVWENLTEYQTLSMFLYIPIYALIAKIVFWGNKKYNFTELFVVFMYVLSQLSLIGVFAFIISAAFSLPIGMLGFIMLPLQVIYSAYCLKQIYELDLFQIIIKTVIFFFVALFFLILIIVVLFAVLYLIGGMELIQQVFPPPQGA